MYTVGITRFGEHFSGAHVKYNEVREDEGRELHGYGIYAKTASVILQHG